MIFILIENKILGGFWGVKKKENNALRIVKHFYRFLHKGFQYETGSYLPLHIKLAGPINFPHGAFGVFISGDAMLGKNCTVFQHVTIGSNMLLDSKGLGAPKIGDNCLIGAGSKIVGNLTIGNNCRIGANCVVTDNIPENCTVVLNKPVIVQKENLVNKVYLMSKNGWGYLSDGNFILEKDEDAIAKLNSIDQE